MEMKEKIRVLRKWNRKYEEREMIGWEMHQAMGCGFGNEQMQNAIDEERMSIVKKLGLSFEDIKKYMDLYEEKEWKFIPEERAMFGEMPKVEYDLMVFYHLLWEEENPIYY